MWWKMKKWVLHITQRLISRYGDPRHCQEGTDRAFSAAWARDCAPKFLEAHLALISQLAEVRGSKPRAMRTLAHPSSNREASHLR